MSSNLSDVSILDLCRMFSIFRSLSNVQYLQIFVESCVQRGLIGGQLLVMIIHKSNFQFT